MFKTVQVGAPALAALLLVGTLAACKGKEQYSSNGTDTTATPQTAAGRVDSAGTPANPSAAPTNTATTTTTWSNPSIVGFAVAANSGEVELGKLGEKKATSSAVKAFARLMVSDHSAMLAESKKLGTKVKVTPDTTTGDASNLANHGRDEIKELTDKPASADWDKNYMDKMVDDHQTVLNKLQDAAKNTTDAQVRTALENAVGKVQKHLTKAQDIRAKLK